jgi:hypothetical protein
MIDQDQDRAKVLRLAGYPGQPEKLSYRIELWKHGDVDTVEKVLARAMSASLARAIFKAARDEYPDRHIVLCRGTRVILDSASE